MKIQVTEDDILLGVQGDCKECPVANALNRIFPDAKIISVIDFSAIMLLKDGSTKSYSLPSIASDFIHNFDMGRKVYPFEFEIE